MKLKRHDYGQKKMKTFSYPHIKVVWTSFGPWVI